MSDQSERLQMIRSALAMSRDAFAERLGLNKNTYAHVDAGRTAISAELAQKLADDLNVNLNWLFSEDGTMFTGPAGVEGIAEIDFLDLQAAAGEGIHAGEIEVAGPFLIKETLLSPYRPEQVKACQVRGDSMIPTLYDGDVVLFVPGVVDGPGVYVLDVFGAYRVKTLDFRLSGDVVVISDNPKYPPETFKRGDETLRVVGMVISWFHKTRH